MRVSLSKKVRFEVFKRDGFTCQYCGAKAPDVVLHVDHIVPVSKGGPNTLLNLATACVACNSGKGARQLNDATIVATQRRQLEEIQTRREQLEMMVEWQTGLANADDHAVDQMCHLWLARAGRPVLLDDKRTFRKLIKKYSAECVLAAVTIAADQYLEFSESTPVATDASCSLALRRVAGVCRVRATREDKPWLQRAFYIRGIVRKRCSYFDGPQALRLLEDAVVAGASLDDLELLAKTSRTWSNWKADMRDRIEDEEMQPCT